MSILEAPRVYFKGEVTWDPIVTNNKSSFYNEAVAETVFPAASDKVAAFRKEAIDDIVGGGNWNPHGTHRAVFYDTAVCGVDLGRGPEQQDPFLAAAVRFTGMLVDLEPYGSISSQLFFDEMRFGAGGGYLISAPRTSRITARYINFARNSANRMIAGIASVVWQSSFAKMDGLRIDAFDSPVLSALQGALADDDVLGLTVRFNAYRTIYFDDPTLRNGAPSVKQATQTLQAKLNGGGFQPNPARSLIVGAIGLWRRDESAHEPGERVLIPPPSSSLGGSAFGRLTGNTLALDLANVIPEIDDALTKQDFGTLSVVAITPATNAETVLATFPYSAYDRAAYEASAGIVTAAVGAAASAAAQGTLQLRGGDGSVLLAEKALRAVPDTPNLYLDQGKTATATARVYERGVRVSKAVPVTLYSMSPGGDKIQAATFAYSSTAFPMLTGTLVTVAGFVPVGFARSTAGEYTFSLFAVVTVALLISWVVAVLFAVIAVGVVALAFGDARRGGVVLRHDLARWVDRTSAVTGETPDELASRALSRLRAGFSATSDADGR